MLAGGQTRNVHMRPMPPLRKNFFGLGAIFFVREFTAI